jgi:Ala-tRNA(Pro) deacylase
MDESARIDLKSIHHRIHAKRVSFGSAELLMQHLGVPPGSVTPFAAINDTQGTVSVVLDAAMMRHEVLNFHPLLNTMTTSIAARDLVTFLQATGHNPRVLGVADEALSGAQTH